MESFTRSAIGIVIEILLGDNEPQDHVPREEK
jgi:hypothetical protein